VGTGKIQQNKAKIGAKKDKITEKRHFPMDFFHKTFIYSIPPLHQQVTITKNGMWRKKLAKNSIHPPLVENSPKSNN
jgi:hypothetical protein